MVDRTPRWVTVPSTSPMRTKSPDPQRARVGDHEAAHDLVHEAARSERHHEAEEDADALERVGLAAGQVRVRHHDREHPQERRSAAGASAAPSRGRSSAACSRPRSIALNQSPISRATNRAMRTMISDREQPGDGVRDAKTQVLRGRQQEPAHRFAPGPRVGEPSKHEADRGVDHDEIQDDRPAPSRPRARRRAVARRGRRRRRRSRFGRPSARRWRRSCRPTARRARAMPHSASRPSTSTAAAAAPERSSAPRRAGFRRFVERVPQALDRLERRRLRRFPRTARRRPAGSAPARLGMRR